MLEENPSSKVTSGNESTEGSPVWHDQRATEKRSEAEASEHCVSDGGNSSLAGVPPSNTTPANCIQAHDAKILRVGVDTLFLSYSGELFEESSIKLDCLKECARSKHPEKQKLAQYEISDHLFMVHDRGRFPYAYILSDNWYRIQVSKREAERTPLAYVRISSESLTFEGPARIKIDLDEVVGQLGLVSSQPTVGWVDLCVDFVTHIDLESIEERDWVTRARKMSTYSDQRKFSGFTIGQGGQMMARLYNKTLEMQGKPRPYLEQIWRDLGWNSHDEVWRLEFQFRREALRQLNIKNFSDLLPKLGGLWTYATTEWLRLAYPDGKDKTKSRWPTHPMWVELQKADWGVDQKCSRSTPKTGHPPGERYLFINGLSAITSYMAIYGITDVEEGFKAYFRDAKVFHDDREHFTDIDFSGYITQKAELKARRYSTLKNVPATGEPHPADVAVAREYRRRSDGE